MPQCWEPGTQYNLGDVVEYEGHSYKIIQPHRSQSDWTPPIVPALWGRLTDGDHHHKEQHHQQQQQYQQPQPQQQPQQQYNPPAYGQPAQVSHEEKQKPWYDLDDHRKQQLEVGGGLAAGAALLAGGYFAFKAHEKNDEEKKAHTWALQNWVQDAKERTQRYHAQGPSGPATWIFNEGKHIPPQSIVVGREKSWTLYICRAYQDGGIQIGKASDVFKLGAVIGYKNEEVHLGAYEILVGDMNALHWVPSSGRLNLATLGYRPVEGGRENDGTLLYIAEALYNDVVHPGKASEKLDGAYIPYDGHEKNVKEYRVLCYKNAY